MLCCRDGTLEKMAATGHDVTSSTSRANERDMENPELKNNVLTMCDRLSSLDKRKVTDSNKMSMTGAVENAMNCNTLEKDKSLQKLKIEIQGKQLKDLVEKETKDLDAEVRILDNHDASSVQQRSKNVYDSLNSTHATPNKLEHRRDSNQDTSAELNDMFKQVVIDHNSASLPSTNDAATEYAMFSETGLPKHTVVTNDKCADDSEPLSNVKTIPTETNNYKSAPSTVPNSEERNQRNEPFALAKDLVYVTNNGNERESQETERQLVDVCLKDDDKHDCISTTELVVPSDKKNEIQNSSKNKLDSGNQSIDSLVGERSPSDTMYLDVNEVTKPLDGNSACKAKHFQSSSSLYVPSFPSYGYAPNLNAYKSQLYHMLNMETANDRRQTSWKPKNVRPKKPKHRPAYNATRRRKYVKTSLESEQLDKLFTFYDKKLQTDDESEEASIDFVDDILGNILNHLNIVSENKFAPLADDEGSVTVDTKVGKLDELDYSVEVEIEDKDEIILSDEPYDFVYTNDDVDTNVIDEIQTTAFVSDCKRFFPDIVRPAHSVEDPDDVPVDHVAVCLGSTDAFKFKECCSGDEWGWILPYPLLHNFHEGISDTLKDLELEGVSLNNGARGPAVTMTILQQDGPNISVDITPKLNIPLEKLRVQDFHWPRKDTKKWLSKTRIKKVCRQTLYLVPKGDKYWKISFANLENKLLLNIDDNGTWRKQCLRVMKKKLIQWKSKSLAGLKSISSYLLKTTLLWLCEILPDDSSWTRDQLANRYINFLQELEHRLKKQKLGEYFNPSVNLLEYKDDDDMEELRKYLLEEIDEFTK